MTKDKSVEKGMKYIEGRGFPFSNVWNTREVVYKALQITAKAKEKEIKKVWKNDILFQYDNIKQLQKENEELKKRKGCDGCI